MSIFEHLEELRSRLLKMLFFTAIGFGVATWKASEIYLYLMKPIVPYLPKDGAFNYLVPTEVFFTNLKIGIVFGLIGASPFILYQLWAFISPGLYGREKRFAIPITVICALFFLGGVAFCYFIVLPTLFGFLIQNSESIRPMLTVKESFSFVLKMLVIFGIFFEIPVFIVALARLGIVTHKTLRRFWPYAVVAILILSAILAPDVVTTLLLAGPLFLLYEMSIWFSYLFEPKREDENEE